MEKMKEKGLKPITTAQGKACAEEIKAKMFVEVCTLGDSTVTHAPFRDILTEASEAFGVKNPKKESFFKKIFKTKY